MKKTFSIEFTEGETKAILENERVSRHDERHSIERILHLAVSTFERFFELFRPPPPPASRADFEVDEHGDANPVGGAA